jgi:hypothetical protein
VAPGYRVFSSAALSKCNIFSMQGTSMATPVVSANALLVRQYFMDGFYPTGSRVAANALRPSGALIKAMLINSATRMHLYVNQDGVETKLGPPPDNYQGFGRLQLSRVLKLSSLSSSVSSLYVSDGNTVSTGAVDVYQLSIPAGGNIREFEVTLTWTDPDSTATAAVIVLHNLDLTVTSALEGRTYFPNGRTSADNVNNVEKIRIGRPRAGDVLTISVRGTLVATTFSQNYALVAAGTFASGAWYCQNPSLLRTETAYRTSYCFASCSTLSKNPICCAADAGATCTTAQASPTSCAGLQRPYDCVSPTPGPTRAPTVVGLTLAEAASMVD